MELPNFLLKKDIMKDFFTYEQQIEKLKSDGLLIDDENKAIEELKLEGYYNIINGYSPLFKKDTHFIKGTTFDHINKLFDFDKALRSIVYKYTSTIERNIKAILAHEFSRIHGVDEKLYLKPESFTSNASAVTNVTRLINECKQTISDALNKNSNKYREYIEHNFTKHGHVPFWVLIRAISFGTTSIFYKNMIEQEKDVIAQNYSLTATQLANMLEVVVSFRNIVAHGERTFCARLPKTRLSTELNIVKKMCIQKNKKGQNKFGRNDFLALLICCKYLLPPVEFTSLISELDMELYELSRFLPPSMFGKIKVYMGLQSDAWRILPKLKIEKLK